MRLFYLIPISLSVWYEKNIKVGIIFSVLTSYLYYYFTVSESSSRLHGFYLIWELVIVCSFYIIFVLIVNQITKDKAALQKSESKFRSLFNNFEVGMFITRLDGSEILDCNDKYLKILNYTREEVVGKPSVNMWADKRERDKMVKMLKADGHVTDFEFDLLNKQGEVRRCVTSLRLYPDKGILEGSLLDITERKKAEEDLKESEEKFHAIFEQAAMGVALLNTKTGQFIRINQKYCDFIGYPMEEMLQKTFMDITYKEDIQINVDKNRELLESDRTEFSMEKRYMHKNGNIIWGNLTISPLWKSGKKPETFYHIGIVEDITGRKHAEEERNQLFTGIQRQAVELDTIFNALPYLVSLHAKDGQYLRVNPTIKKIFGFDPTKASREEIAQRLKAHFPDGQPLTPKNMPSNRALEGEAVYNIEYIVTDVSGNERTLLYNGIPWKMDGEVQGAVFVQEDITERKQAEFIIQKQNEQLQELNATKDKFFSIIAHDLRSPFTGFLGLTQTITEEASNISAQELTLLGSTMHKAADNLFRLLQNLLEWALMQSGSASIVLKDISLTNMITQNVEEIKVRSEQKGISINNIVTDHIRAYADEKMINSVLLNLLSNAVKFTNRNGAITVNVKEIADQMIEISVRDTGVGMPKSMMEKLFKLGEKTGRKGTEGELSTGLGLLLCKEFIEKNNGRIWVDSEEGAGSTFHFTLRSKE
jgi:PAS domain S-box-containing protein